MRGGATRAGAAALTLSDRRVYAIFLTSLAFVCFTGIDTCAKWLAQDMPTAQIVFARYFGQTVIVTLAILPTAGLAAWRSEHPWLQVGRSFMLFAATTCNFFALHYLQLAVTSAIFFTVPLLVAALSAPMLGEHVGARRWAAIVLGLVGALIVVRPGLGVLHWAVAFSFCTALFTALYQVTTRRLAAIDSTRTTLLYTALVGTVAIAPFVPASWTPPASALDWAVMAAIGAIASLGHLVFIVAHRYAPAPVLAPFLYQQILYMTLAGYLVFGQVPDAWVFVGAGVVVVSGLYVWHRERLAARRAAREAGA